jgi:hypothetical protein
MWTDMPLGEPCRSAFCVESRMGTSGALALATVLFQNNYIHPGYRVLKFVFMRYRRAYVRTTAVRISHNGSTIHALKIQCMDGGAIMRDDSSIRTNEQPPLHVPRSYRLALATLFWVQRRTGDEGRSQSNNANLTRDPIHQSELMSSLHCTYHVRTDLRSLLLQNNYIHPGYRVLRFVFMRYRRAYVRTTAARISPITAPPSMH